MTRDTRRAGWLARLWMILMDASQAAVAIHYGAPWRADIPPNT